MSNGLNKQIEIPVERCRDNVVLPRFMRPGDAGMDICAAEDTTIMPGQTVLIPTGLKFAVPPGYEMQVRPRSGISLNTALRLPNSPGTIDSGYRGEVGVIMTNTWLPDGANTIDDIMGIGNNLHNFPVCGLDGSKADVPCVYKINAGDRIAQIVIQAIPAVKLIEVEDVCAFGNDRLGGVGSTGINDI